MMKQFSVITDSYGNRFLIAEAQSEKWSFSLGFARIVSFLDGVAFGEMPKP